MVLRFTKRALILLIIAAIAFVGVAFVRYVLKTRHFKTALDKQLQVVERICHYHPTSWSQNEWGDLQVTTYNVWANVVLRGYPDTPTPDEMKRLQADLDAILAATTPNNWASSIDRVYELMLTVPGARPEFSEGYRKSFRDILAAPQQSP